MESRTGYPETAAVSALGLVPPAHEKRVERRAGARVRRRGEIRADYRKPEGRAGGTRNRRAPEGRGAHPRPSFPQGPDAVRDLDRAPKGRR